MSKSRVEAFSDGVIAVAITLLVLSIKVPNPHDPGSLAHRLDEQWPHYIAYVISFLTIGVIWINHHAMMRRLTLNIAAEIRTRLKGKECRVYANDMRVAILETGLYTYPDVVAVCGEVQFRDDKRDTLINPVLLIEVLSESTERYDRGTKSQHYRRIESLCEYLLVAQDKPYIERYGRQDDGVWTLTDVSGLDGILALSSLGCTIPLAEIYERVDLSNPSDQYAARTCSPVTQASRALRYKSGKLFLANTIFLCLL